MYFVFSILMFVFKFVFRNYINTPVEWNDLLRLPIKDLPGTPYWYLYVLAIIYFVATFLFKQRWNESAILGSAFVICMVYKLINLEAIFTIQYAFYYSFYFLLGCIFQIRGRVMLDRHYFMQWLIIVFGGSVLLIKKDDMSVSIIGVMSVFLATLTINFLFFFFSKYLDHLGVLSFLGERSLEIYIFHIYVTSGSRPILKLLHMENYWGNVFILFFMGIVFPLLGSYILKKLKLWDLFFKPTQYWQKIYDSYKK